MGQPGRRQWEQAARALEARRAELDLNQDELGVDASTYRDLIYFRHWSHPRTRAKIEVRLGWDVGTIAQIASQPVPGNGLSGLAAITDDEDERALLGSDLSDDQKRRLLSRLWTAENFPAQPGEEDLPNESTNG